MHNEKGYTGKLVPVDMHDTIQMDNWNIKEGWLITYTYNIQKLMYNYDRKPHKLGLLIELDIQISYKMLLLYVDMKNMKYAHLVRILWLAWQYMMI